MNRPAAIGIVLAGGGARRMQAAGSGEAVHKEAIAVAGATLLERVVAAVGRETGRVVVVTAPGRPLPGLSRAVEVVADSAPGSGPLAAMQDGLGHVAATIAADGPAGPLVFVASCDLPFLSPRVVRLLLDRAGESGADWTAAHVGGHVQVLASVVRLSLRGPLRDWLAGGRRDPAGLFAMLAARTPARTCLVTAEACRAVDPGLDSFRDLDTPEDLARARRQLAYGGGNDEAYTPRP